MIPEHQVTEVRARADIAEIIGEHVPLKRAGKDLRGLCPFHQERTPSFYVVPAKGIYKCFGCGEAGDVFTFLMRRQGLSFQDAVRQVAARVGVEIRETAGGDRVDEARARLYEAVAFAADFYRRQLWERPEGSLARDYLAGRGVSRQVAERFGLGYAPDAWHELRDAARKHGIEDQVLLEAGLVKEGENQPEPYDRLRRRLVFPIEDLAGRVIAFGGRILGPAREGVPKYLNSPETPLYQKGSVLYGLSWAKNAIRREQAVLVVEGYMDYIAVAAAGFENVVAPLGTAMTEAQAGTLARYAKRALLLYDSDTAGLKATFRSADELLRAGVHPLVATLPRGEDPDSVLRAGGPEALARVLENAVDVLDRKIEILEERGYFQDIDGQRKALDGLLPTLRAVKDPALRDIYVARVAERTGVKRETLERERDRATTGAARPAASTGRAAPSSRAAGRDPVERMLVLLLLRDRDRIPAVTAAIAPGDLRDPAYREIYQAIVAGSDNAPGSAIAGLDTGVVAEEYQPEHAESSLPAWLDGERVAALSPEARRALESLARDPEEFTDGDRILDDLLGEIRVRTLFSRLDALDQRMTTADAEEQASLLAEKAAIRLELSSLGRLGFKVSRRYRRSAGGVVSDASVPSIRRG